MTEAAPAAGLASLQGLPADLINVVCVFCGPSMTLVLHRLCKRWYQILRDGDALCWQRFALRIPSSFFTLYVPRDAPQPEYWRASFVRRFRHARLAYDVDQCRLMYIHLLMPADLARIKSPRKKVLYFLSWCFKYAAAFWDNVAVPRPSSVYRQVVYLRTLSVACRRAHKMSDPWHRAAVLKAIRFASPDRGDLSAAASAALRNCDSNRFLGQEASVLDFYPRAWT